MSIILKAKEFAKKAHVGDTYGDYPYTKHLNDVYLMLLTAGVKDEKTLAVAWLHDTIEDTVIRYEDVLEAFGEKIADITYAVTDKRGKTRVERHEATYPTIAKDARATLVKVADRAANFAMSKHERQKQFYKYEREHVYFKATLLEHTFGIPEFDDSIKFLSDFIDSIIKDGPLVEGIA